MIRQILSEKFLSDRSPEIQRLQMELAQPVRLDAAVQAKLQSEGVTAEEVQAALALLKDGPERVRKTLPKDHTVLKNAYIPPDAALSLFQTALESFYEEQRPDLIQQSSASAAAGGQVPVTDRELTINAVGSAAGKLLDKFSVTDIGWSSTIVASGLRLFRGKHAFKPTPATPFTIANNARVILIGDWASGTPRARKVGEAMRAELLKNGPGPGNQHVIHLGDTYYSGYTWEYKKRFLPFWPVQPSEENRFTSWSLNGNHDMYSGGYGYFDFLLQDPRFKRQEQSSFFSLQNDYWKILGLDTAYEDFSLQDPQAQWVQDELRGTKQKGMLLSHHQPFSSFESGGEKLLGKIQPALDQKLVRAWFWGHEHRCALYKPLHNIAYPRLLGDGGVPVYADTGDLPQEVAYEHRESFPAGWETWALFGFAVLDFQDQNINVRYINEYGAPYKTETLS
jgi:hypothetical protein